MRKFSVFCMLLLYFFPARAQWSVNYAVPNHNLVDIQFTSALTGYIAGDDGANAFILKTIDGGQIWTMINLPISYISNIYFLNDTVGYLIQGGVPVRFAKTIDGGQTWTGTILPDSCFTTPGLAAMNDSTGFYLNNAGRLRKFLSSGDSIVRITDTLIEGSAILFPTATTGYIPQFIYTYRTTDAGQSWTVLPTNLTDWIGPCVFTDSITGYASTRDAQSLNGTIVKTTDGAQSWQTLNNFLAAELAADGQYILAIGDTGLVKWSPNAGLSWANESLGVPYQGIETYKAAVTSNHNAYVIDGYGGQILQRNLPLSLAEVNAEPVFAANVFPNPAENSFDIRTSQNGMMQVTITNLAGQIVLSENTNGHVSIGSLAAGSYLVQIKQNDQVCVRKLIKK